MKKILIPSLSIIISCTQYPNEVKQTPSVQVSSNNSKNQNNTQKINSLEDITNEMRYKYIKNNLELHHCHKDSFYLSYYDPFGGSGEDSYNTCNGQIKYEREKIPYSKIYSEYEKLVKNSKNFEEVKDINNFMKDYDCQTFSFKCFYCESEENFLKNNIDFDLSQVGKFYISKDANKIYIMTNNENMDKTYQHFQNVEKDNLDYYYDSDFKKSISINDDGTIKRKAIYIIDNKNNIKTLKVDNKLPFSCNLYDFYYDGENNFYLRLYNNSEGINFYSYNNTYVYNNSEGINFYSFRNTISNDTHFRILTNSKESLFGIYFFPNKSYKINEFISIQKNRLDNIGLDRLYYVFESNKFEKLKMAYIDKKLYITPKIISFCSTCINLTTLPLLEETKISELNTEGLRSIKNPKSLKIEDYLIQNVIPENNLVKEITDMKANSKGEIIILDNPSNVLWRVVPFKSIEKLAGKKVDYTNGDKNMLNFINPLFIDIDKDDNIYVLDKGRKEILKISDDKKNEINKDYSVFYKQVGDKIKVKY